MTRNCTDANPAEEEAVAPNVTVPETGGPAVGAVMLTVGGGVDG